MADIDIERLRTREPEFLAGYSPYDSERKPRYYYPDPLVTVTPFERDAIFAALDEARADAKEAIAIGLRQQIRFNQLRKFLDEARAELKDTKAELERTQAGVREATANCAQHRAECERLRKALEWYATKYFASDIYLQDDLTRRAREALAASDGKQRENRNGRTDRHRETADSAR